MFFRMHPSLLFAAPSVFVRGAKLAPKVDLWTLLALHSRIPQTPSGRRVYGEEDEVPCVTIPCQHGILLELLGARRDRVRPGRPPEFWGSDGRALSRSLSRLGGADVKVPISVRRGRRHKRFVGRLVSIEHEEREVTLRCCAPPVVGYFALVPNRIFTLKAALGETATVVLCWLIAWHRGSRRAGASVLHRWTLEVSSADLAALGVLSVDHGRVGEAWQRFLRGLGELEAVGIVQALVDGDRASVELSREFFHCESGRVSR